MLVYNPPTHLCQVVYERQVSLLQFCSRQTGQGVGVVQLFTVVSGEQVGIQTNHMGGICWKGEGTALLPPSVPCTLPLTRGFILVNINFNVPDGTMVRSTAVHNVGKAAYLK